MFLFCRRNKYHIKKPAIDASPTSPMLTPSPTLIVVLVSVFPYSEVELTLAFTADSPVELVTKVVAKK